VSKKGLTLILAGLAMVGPFSIDTYLPSFPAIAHSLGVDAVLMQQTLSVYLFAFALMMLFHGTLADTFGRRRVILIAIAIYTLASVGAALAPSFRMLLLFRAVQGACAGAGMVVGRAIVRDLMHGVEAQRMLAHITMVFGIGPAIAPILGGWLHTWFGWRSIFVFLACVGTTLGLIVYLRLPESLPRENRQPAHVPTMLRNYYSAICNRQFVLLALSVGFGFSGFGLYVAAAPDLIINILHLPETAFAWLFIPLISGQVLGAWASSRMANYAAPGEMVLRGYLFMLAGAILNVAYNLWVEVPSVPWATLPLIVYTFGVALLIPTVTLRILDLFPHTRGLAASLQSFIQTLVFALTSALVPVAFGSALKLAGGLSLGLLFSASAYWVSTRVRKLPAPTV
jgi:MFS transporter, DHA1 family, multidrug resistance protein